MQTILLTDDNATWGTLLTALLQEEGYAVFYIPRKDKAIELLSTIQPDLIITDLSPAPIDGFELLYSVAPRNPATPVVVISGMMDKEIEQKARRLGASICFAKPLGITEFLTRIEQVLKQSQFCCAA